MDAYVSLLEKIIKFTNKGVDPKCHEHGDSGETPLSIAAMQEIPHLGHQTLEEGAEPCH